MQPLHLQSSAYEAVAFPAKDCPTTGTDVTATGSTPTSTSVICVETPVTSSDDGISIGIVAIAVLAAAALAALAGFFLGRRRNAPPTAQPPPQFTPPTQPDVVYQPDPHTAAARESLIEFLVELRDRTESDSLSGRIGDALDRVGIRTDDPTGQSFDATNHVAQAPPLPTDDRTLDGKVAQIVTYGYWEGDHVRRAPVVVVWRARAGAGAPQ